MLDLTLCGGGQVIGIDVLSGCKVRTVQFAPRDFLAFACEIASD